MDNNFLEGEFNLIEKKKIALMISHKENLNIFEKYLKSEYEVITNDFTEALGKIDLIIADEQGLKDNIDDIFRSKSSSSYLYIPLLLITRIAKEDLSDQELEIIDEIIEIPIDKRILASRIKILLSIRTLILSTQVFQKVIESNPLGICILVEDKKIKYVNNAFLDIIERNRKNTLNKNILEVFPNQKLNEYFSKNRKEKSSSTIKLDISNNIKWINIQCIEINYKNIKLKSLIFIDVTESKIQQKEIEYLSYKDKLTGLYNRRFFEEEMERLDTVRQLPLSFIMADVNGLKIINDSYGHESGDELLVKTADLFKEVVRDEDIIARQGGDEFAILLPKTKKEYVEEIVKRIKEKIKESSNQKIPISIALGIATKENIEEDIKGVFKRADDNMYQNKLSESRNSKNNIVQGLLNSLNAKSDETKDHEERMKKLAFDFGEKLNLSDSELNRLYSIAKLHDIGKTNINEKILNKIEELNKEEWEIMKNHSNQGYKIASSSEKFALVADEILAHHEHWDGSGYPEGSKGEDIPYLARIITIIDAYDVMTNDRYYSKAISKKEALKEIKECAGTQFDPELARKFIEMIDEE